MKNNKDTKLYMMNKKLNALLNSNSEIPKLTLLSLLNKLLMPPEVDVKMLWVPPMLTYKSPTTTFPPLTLSFPT